MKSSVTIPVYSDQDLTPKAQDVIREVVNSGFPDHIVRFGEWYPGYSGDSKVLVFGNMPDAPANYKKTQFVNTYSIAQMMTKANAATVLKSAVRQFIQEPEKIPFHKPLWTKLIGDFKRYPWDFSKPAVIDIETDGNLGKVNTPEEVNIISVAIYQEGLAPLVLLGIWDEDEERTRPLSQVALDMLAKLLPLFEYAIYHNGKFDIRVLNRLLGVELRNSFDTMLAHHVLNQAAGDHKLKHLCRQYLGAPEWEADLKKYTKGGGHYELIPSHLLALYNGWDVYWTYKLYEFLFPQIEADEEAMKAFALEMAYADFLLEVEQWGIPFDAKYATELGSILSLEVQAHTDSLRGIVGDGKFNPGSWQQIKKVVSELWKMELESTDAEHIEELKQFAIEYQMRELQAFCEHLLAFRKAKKALGTYVQGWTSFSRDGRVHPTYLVHGTSTGRLSSSSPNAQNVPRDKKIRRLVALSGEKIEPIPF